MVRKGLRLVPALPLTFVLMALTLSAPANAGGDGWFCRPVWTWVGTQLKLTWKCEPIPLLIITFPGDGGCPECGIAFLWRHDYAVNPEKENRFAEQVSTGLRLIGRATRTTDPATAAQLRTDALNAFTTAASTSGFSPLSLQSAGAANPTTGVFTARPDLAWAAASAADVLDGVAELKRVLYPGPVGGSRAAAMRQFEEAYTELSQQRAIAG
ncbi:MAG: hypothetical protein HOY78_12620 [Saccharothrix sp.]|nr:hypothetical protein [Saccharothrix sp.]